MMMNIANRIDALRVYMREQGFVAFIVVSSDAHSSEYVAERWKTREWISGFDGSAGTAVITMDKALLWTDSRYWLAAENAFKNTEYELMKDGSPDTPSIAEWLCANLAAGETVGVDGNVCSIAEVDMWRNRLATSGIALDISKDPFDYLWSDRPDIPSGVAQILPVEYSGETAVSKLKRLRAALSRDGVDGMLVTMLDEVAWLTNMRGTDVQYNPVLVSYLLVTDTNAILFVQERKITEEVRCYLNEEGFDIAPYDAVWNALANYDKKTLLLNPAKCNASVQMHLNEKCEIVFKESPICFMKAVKNSVEIAGFKKAMLSEGVAMIKLLHWLSAAVRQGGVTELDVDRKLTEYRSIDNAFCGLSFSTIAAYAQNAAIVHYEPTNESHATLLPEGFLLLDCGGQYMCGTTDVTRTITLGKLTCEEKEDYTRVLKGHISLAMAKFPKGTCGTQLDVLARQWLWQVGENYLHGTGHGVGHFLNVHEGPHQIRMNNVPTPLQPGMTVTNEPGLYKAGRHGIRIENTMLVVECLSTEFGDFYALEPLTVCPIDKKAILPELLSIEEREYIDNYHKRVWELLSPCIKDMELLAFLEELCAPL